MTKVEMSKDTHLQMWILLNLWCGKLYAISIGQIRSKPISGLVITDWPVHKLQVCKSITCPIQIAKCLPHQVSKRIHICKWRSFAISTIVIYKDWLSLGTSSILNALHEFIIFPGKNSNLQLKFVEQFRGQLILMGQFLTNILLPHFWEAFWG